MSEEIIIGEFRTPKQLSVILDSCVDLPFCRWESWLPVFECTLYSHVKMPFSYAKLIKFAHLEMFMMIIKYCFIYPGVIVLLLRAISIDRYGIKGANTLYKATDGLQLEIVHQYFS